MLGLYAVTLFWSSALLFVVQPLVAKMLLPTLGGSPAVWNTCLVFFQAALLAGYAYAHWVSRWLGARTARVVHAALLLMPVALLTLPLAFPLGWSHDASRSPVLPLLGLLTMHVGPAFLVVSTSAPMLSRWFSATDHAHASDPYFLYAASNLGSLLSLLAFPLLLERWLSSGRLSQVWALGYLLLMLAVLGCAVVSRRRAAKPESADGAVRAAAPIAWRRRLRWLGFAFVPSSTLLGVTTFITTDVASTPLFWVVPLALYLTSFVLVFARRQWLPHGGWVRVLPALALLVAVLIRLEATGPLMLLVPLNLAVFFALCMVCHGELARDRPAASQLTEFYLVLSIGGVLGGAFNALLAPAVFPTVIEYPLALVLALLLCPPRLPATHDGSPAARARDYALAGALFALAASLAAGLRSLRSEALYFGLAVCLPAAIAYAFVSRPVRFGLGVGGLLLAGAFAPSAAGHTLETHRSFFGVHRVTRHSETAHHVLMHGTTAHGRQAYDPSTQTPTAATTALVYYHAAGPVGDVMRGVASRGAPARIGVVGLGAGSLAAYARAGDALTFYEIDPSVQRIAEDTRYFTFLAGARQRGASVDVALGDARVTLPGAPDAHFDLLVLDAFSSDSIPLHLLTEEAFALYARKLRPEGLLAFHISNRHLNVYPQLVSLSRATGLASRLRADDAPPAGAGTSASDWAVLARSEATLERALPHPTWRSPPAGEYPRPWSDDHSNVLSVLR